MSREKQIEEIFNDMIEAENRFHEHCLSNVCHDCEYYGDGECDNHIKAEFLYNAGYRKQEWISVDERLPEKDEYVLCYSEYDCVFVGYRGFHSGAWMSGGVKYCGTITHWMPLPEPPKMKGGAE